MVPREFIPAVEKGINEAIDARRAGWLRPVVDVRSRCTSVRTAMWTRTNWRSDGAIFWFLRAAKAGRSSTEPMMAC